MGARMRRLLRERSLGWWGLVLCLLLAVGAYIVFDVLDLDGSDLRNRVLQSPLVSQTALAEAERVILQAAKAQFAVAGISFSALLPQSFTLFNTTCFQSPSVNALTQFRTTLPPRVYAARDSFPMPRPTDDPARPLVHTV